MMSHPVTLSSPPPSPLLTLQPSNSLTAQSIFSLQDKLRSLTCAVGWYEGHTNAVISSSRRPFRLTETSNRHFPKSSRHHINRHTVADVSLPCCLKVPTFFYFFYFLTRFFPSNVHMRWIQMGLFLKAVMEYDILIIFPRPWQIASTAYYACFLTFILFVSLPQWPLNLGFVGNGR